MLGNDKRRAFGVFSTRQEAEQALNELKNSGFSMDHVSVLARDAEQDKELSGAQMSDRIGNKDVGNATGVVGEVATNSALGAVLVGLSSLAIPGVGVVIAAGSVATALAATVAGTGIEAAAFGGLVKAVSDLGIPEEQARVYADRLYGGDYLVIVDGTDNQITTAQTVFSDGSIQDWNVYNCSET